MKQEATLIRARLKTPRAAAVAVYEKFGYDFCDTRDPKVEANEANRAAHLQSSLPPVRDRRRNAAAPTERFFSFALPLWSISSYAPLKAV